VDPKPLGKLHFYMGWVCEDFLEKYFPIGKTVKLRNEINHFI